MPAGRVLIAFDDGPLEPDPTWARLDDIDNLVAEITIRTGRQDELDETSTGTCTVRLNDTDGLFDPANTGSPYFGQIDGRQILIQLYNPVNDTWYSRFRGIIDDYGYDLHPSQVISNIQVECVDVFDYLAAVDLLPGVHGDVAPAGSEGNVFYEYGPVDERVESILVDVGIDPDMYVVFSGNVNVGTVNGSDLLGTLYDSGDKALVALRDAADAEFPGIANIYCDRFGRFVFHGRGARIDPDGVSATAGDAAWDFQRWKVGDGDAIAGDSGYAQMRPPFSFRRSRNRIINAALVLPRGVVEANIPGLVYSDATSIAAYGVRSVSWTDLIHGGHKTNGNTGEDECGLVAEFYVENFKDPRNRVEALTVKAMRPTDARAAATWAVLCRSDISDVVTVTVGYPGGVGLDEDFYIEGWEQTITPLNPDHDMVELSLNVSPTAYYTENVWGGS